MTGQKPPGPPGRYRVRRVSGVISTDDLIAGRHKHSTTDAAALAQHLLEDRMPGFAATVRTGDAIVADAIFGIGSSREQAVSALLAAGIRLVIAPAYGRIFFRNCWNLGLPAIDGCAKFPLAEGDELEVDLSTGRLWAWGNCWHFGAVPREMLQLLDAGGLLPYIQKMDLTHGST